MSEIAYAPAALNQRILIIDDNTSIHSDIRKILCAPDAIDSDLDAEAAALFGGEAEAASGTEFEIDSAYQGQEGLEMVNKALAEGRPYAMAFVDVRMPPGWDGVQTISHIWEQYPELQVVICTAYSDYSWEGMIRKVGKTDSLVILKKPFDNVEVLQLAHTLTQKWSLSRQLKLHMDGLDEVVARRTIELQTANFRLREEMDERAQTQRELARSEERFSKAFRSSPIPMMIQSLGQEIVLDMNDAFLELTGRDRVALLNLKASELGLYASDDAYYVLLVELRIGTSLRNYECLLKGEGAVTKEVLISAEIFELGGEPVALIAALDVSKQRKLENQLRHSQKLEAVGQLAAGVAHDFNNILTVIQGHTSMQLAVKNLEHGVADSLRQVSAAADKAAALTRQLLAFSRKQIVQPKVLDLNEIVRGMHEMLRRVIGEHIDLQCELAENLPGIYADEANLEQIMMNLVVNARDAMSLGGTLTLRTSAVEIDADHVARHAQARLGATVALALRDTGCGMTQEVLDHMYEPFYSTKEVGQGSGLGLATVYGIVAQHEGWIEVESAPQKGTTFTVYLPASLSGVEPVSVAPGAEVGRGTETILVVEDEPAVREVVTEMLNAQGYHVLQAIDGLDALSVWSKRKAEIDLVVTDIVMPNGLLGHVLADRLLADKKELKIIFSSGYSEEFATADRPAERQFSFLQKPYRLEELVHKVRTCLDN